MKAHDFFYNIPMLLWAVLFLVGLVCALIGDPQSALIFMLGFASAALVACGWPRTPGSPRSPCVSCAPRSPRSSRSPSEPVLPPVSPASAAPYPGDVSLPDGPDGPGLEPEDVPRGWFADGALPRDGDEQAAGQARWRNDPLRPTEGVLRRRRDLDPALRDELDEDGEREWWGATEG